MNISAANTDVALSAPNAPSFIKKRLKEKLKTRNEVERGQGMTKSVKINAFQR